MKTLQKLKRNLKQDTGFHRTLLRSAQTELLIDLDGDGEADIALLDVFGNGEIDYLAVDPDGSGEFNLYIGDTDKNGSPDIIRYGEDGSVCKDGFADPALVTAASLVRFAVVTGEYTPDTLAEKLEELERRIKQAQGRAKTNVPSDR